MQSTNLQDKPENPFRKDSIRWSLIEGEWDDLTVDQIAEVLYTTPKSVKEAIKHIRKKLGYSVPYRHKKSGRPRNEDRKSG